MRTLQYKPGDERLDVSAGGLLSGPGTDTSDDIPAIGLLGTGILNAEAVRVIGVERIDALVTLATETRMRFMLSTGEYVVPSAAASVLGEAFWRSLNDAGNVLRDSCSPDPELHRQLVNERVDLTLRDLATIRDDPTGELANNLLKEWFR